LQSIEFKLGELARTRGHSLSAFQSNAEHELIAKIHATTHEGIAFVIVNPAGSPTPASPCAMPFSRWTCRSSRCISATCSRARLFGSIPYLSDIAVGCIFGLGPIGYELALEAACARLTNT